MKCAFLVMTVLGLGLLAQGEWVETGGYSGTYVDAFPEGMAGANTRPVDPSITDWLITGASEVDKWRWRDTEIIEGVNDNAHFQANGTSATSGDKPMLVTTLSGLPVGALYEVYVVYWDDDGVDALGDGNQWQVMAGLDPENLSVFGSNEGKETGTGRGREQYEAYVGSVVVDENGEIRVYVDDLPNPGSSSFRTLYDGIVLLDVSKRAWNPDPADGETGVGLDRTLSWNKGPDPGITKHYVYFGEFPGGEPNFVGMAPVTVTDLEDPIELEDLPALEYDKTYFWRVDSSIQDSGPAEPNTYTGQIWSFETRKSIPRIVTEPVDLVLNQAEMGQDREVFAVEVSSLSPASYQWYKSVDNFIDDPGDMEISGATDSVLTLTGIEASDEGYYFCKIMNDATLPVGSEPPLYTDVVRLGIGRLVAHWRLDNTAADYAGGQYIDVSTEDPEPHNADPNGSPLFVNGILGPTAEGAVQMTVATGWARAGTWDPSQFTDAVTLSAWVKWDGTPTTTGIVGKRDSYTAQRWTLAVRDNGTVRFYNPSDLDVWPDDVLPVNEWVFVVATYDGTEGRVYLNGELKGVDTGSLTSTVDAMIMVGALEDDTTPGPLAGVLDDVKIYNYARTSHQIAAECYDVSGYKPCAIWPLSPFDFNLDCMVDLQDLALFAAEWLTCGRYPNCDL